jgi:hypothetical protein
MAPFMNRLTLTVAAGVAVLAGCGQDIDLGASHQPLPPESLSPKSATTGCPIEDPALLKAPAACPDPLSDPLGVTAACVVTAEGPVRAVGTDLPAVPACPTGVYLTLNGPLPAVENIERAVVVHKGDDEPRLSLVPGAGAPVPRTVEAFPDRNSIFVRLDPRPSNGLRVNVLLVYAELFRGVGVGPAQGEIFGYIVGFHAGAALP